MISTERVPESMKEPEKIGISTVSSPSNVPISNEKAQETEAGIAQKRSPKVGLSRSGSKEEHILSKERAYIRKTIGDWQLGKTLGSGSMGKVKVVTHMSTNEIAAVKIIPRPFSQGISIASQNVDYGKEVRTIREIAISSLLQHPYICTLRDVKIQPNHYYVFFEYINGGQMLDYIISHGKLKEKQARKFARQIGSALDYCHRNSIVHRDLKIENILISKEGDIKMIDFGLSNLYSPHSQLSTFCGSLYFAAPELLNAKAYIGPEIDIWSFGVVLYVLVCGKVPFDDQNMPALHAKIKRGHVEYPSWLTIECKQLLSRMLVTSPSQRATLSEILNHPWMMRGYDCPPNNYLPPRYPITFPLDMEIIRRMTGFDFGNEQTILAKLTNILESEGYRKLVKAYYNQSHDTHVLSLLMDKKKNFFDFYKRKISSSPSNPPLSSDVNQHPLKSKPIYIDAYHPLISIYYLVKEKIEREKKCNYQDSYIHGNDHYEALNSSTPISANLSPLDHKDYHNTIPSIKKQTFPSRARARTYDEKEVATAIKDISSISPNTVDNHKLIKESKEKNFKIFRRFSSKRIKKHFSNPTSILPSLIPVELLTPPPKSLSNKYSHDVESLRETDAKVRLSNPFANVTNLKRSVSINDNAYLSRRISPPLHIHNPSSSKDHLKDMKKNSITENGTQPSFPKPFNVVSTFSFKGNRTKSLGHAKSEVLRKEKKCQRQSSVLIRHNSPTTIANSNKYVFNHACQSLNSTQPSQEVTVKSGFLKGIFSVSTTTSKPPHIIKSDLICILNCLNISFRDIKGGVFCIYQPSINLKDFINNTIEPNHHAINPKTQLKRSISLHKMNYKRKKNGIDIHPNTIGSESDDSLDNGKNKNANFTIQFEIYIVKVPLFALHGLQFKRVGGNAWQYRSLASRIIAEMKL
ncbi:hypothetical protein T552_02506 [Pneumocystis carinii B80]|uniref:non-specific serine/threonine protein kinase n=1 Tax=Pneumocystis carinii (strain B80) TaxID=1408658 RepID=A0A0W4ZF77_PNEC8|nr:hypothetical protein T552_02506 [Pneumocystis carinii B80]KTW27013.1 hypothetical protein T552_02506 [Pneumocystis carinii B80]